MKEIGKLLKKMRGKMNISLTDVHKAIKIRKKYISAIGDISVFLWKFIIEVF